MSTPAAQRTLTIESRVFRIVPREDDTMPYELIGPRGARYILMRNVPNPHILFPVNGRGFMKHTPNWWFTDKDGELRQTR